MLFIYFIIFLFSLNKDTDLLIIYADNGARFVIKGYGEIDGADLTIYNSLKLKGKNVIPEYKIKLPIQILLGNNKMAVIEYKDVIFKLEGYCVLTLDENTLKEMEIKDSKTIKLNLSNENCMNKSQKICETEKEIKNILLEKGYFVIREFLKGNEYNDIITKIPKKILNNLKGEEVRIAKVINYDNECLYISKFYEITEK